MRPSSRTRACTSRSAREHPDAPETDKREESFRRNCRDLLLLIYGLLSRVSLHAHYTDRERVLRMGALGFSLVPCQRGPIPDPDDVAALSILIACVVFLPLSYQVTIPRAILISLEVCATILVPIVLLPAFLPLQDKGTRHPTVGLSTAGRADCGSGGRGGLYAGVVGRPRPPVRCGSWVVAVRQPKLPVDLPALSHRRAHCVAHARRGIPGPDQPPWIGAHQSNREA